MPSTILRATQFYDLVYRGARALAKLPIVPVPAGFLTQPIHPDDVAAELVKRALAAPGGRVPDLAGPQVLSFAEILRTYLKAAGRRRPLLSVWLPGLGKIRKGALIPDADHPAFPANGHSSWTDFLAAKLSEEGNPK